MSRPIQVTVFFFHTLEKITGRKRLRIKAQKGQKVADLLKHLYQIHPELQRHDQALLIAVNESYVRRSVALRDGDEVALLPPVSGG